MTRLKAIQRIGNHLKEGVRGIIPVKSSRGSFLGRNSLSRREFVKYGTGLTLALFPLLSCGSAFRDDSKEDTPAVDPGLPRISFQVTFSEPMERASVEEAVSISPEISPSYTGSFTWSGDDTVLNYITNVDDEVLYTVTIAGTAKDRAGNFLDGDEDGSGGDAYSFTVDGVV